MKDFDLLQSDLCGINLIEASAGTGKTYTIAGVYLRLLLEKGLLPADILVVTYTVAATQELEERVRRKIRDAREAFVNSSSDNPLLRKLLGSYDRQRAIDRLTVALRLFDEAAIFTIHGFCQRVLKERAFESGSPFDRELITDEEILRQDVVADFWRKNIAFNVPEVTSYAIRHGYSASYFARLAADSRIGHETKIITGSQDAAGKAALAKEVELFRGLIVKLGALWDTSRYQIRELLMGCGLNARIYDAPKIEKILVTFDGFFSLPGAHFPLFEDFEKLCRSFLHGKLKKNHRPPEHAFFDLCEQVKLSADRLADRIEGYVSRLKVELLDSLPCELSLRKAKSNVISYDDLLTELRSALRKPHGETLATALRNRYRAILIDEFQDTDSIQYEILMRIFNESGQPHRMNSVFLIGDPKQAIFGFRGADVFSYLRASQEADRRYTLTENWRSTPGLIRAVNALFAGRCDSFVNEAISFREGKSAGEVAELSIDEKRVPPFQWWLVAPPEQTENIGGRDKGLLWGKERAREMITWAVAAEITKLLALGREKRALIGDKPVAEDDIAVVVRTNLQAWRMREALLKKGVRNVLLSMESVFATKEAESLEIVLKAILQPAREDWMRAALATDVFGLRMKEIEALSIDEELREERLTEFRECHELWLEKGIIVMVTTLLAKEGIAQHILQYRDGRRRLTNLSHLSELLHDAARSEGLTMDQTLAWLTKRRGSVLPARDEYQLRLDQDGGAVRIVTVHKSKGMEYPIVFCPFLWEVPQVDGPIFFHGEDGGLCCDIDGEQELPKENSRREQLAESVRLTYVALTRASKICHVTWGAIKDAESSALAHLLGEGGLRFFEGGAAQAVTEHAAKVPQDVKWGPLPEASDIELPQPMEQLQEKLVVRDFPGRIERPWQITSYSLISAGLHGAEETPDYDHDDDVDGQAENAKDKRADSIFSLPGGVRSGVLFHSILENFDFCAGVDENNRRLIAAKLSENSFPPMWQSIIERTLLNIVDCPLEFDSVKDGQLKLSELQSKDCLREVEFVFPMENASPRSLGAIYRRWGDTDLPETFHSRLNQLPVGKWRGFMKGFIDMIFQYGGRYWIVDWKSNYLGDDLDDYSETRLRAVMAERSYFLQCHIYVLALHRYLARRLRNYDYDRDLGGAFYLFLRGMDPQAKPHNGIYWCRPSLQFIAALDRQL
ncbi:MAG: exodeoxyribonuclease V subunit beta [Smithellaceae bacterium]|nr:exodeoxyribonuclease V subunit beta [Smithellaceae bacterium]